MNYFEQNLATYDGAAKEMADKFDKIGVRKSDIDETIDLIGRENPFVVELGCGNGRDAEYICKKTDRYLGVDFSKKMIELAKKKIPNSNFKISSIEDFNFPNNVDVIIAFASFIHLPFVEIVKISTKLHSALIEGGVKIIHERSPEIRYCREN